MILVYITQPETASVLIKSASELAVKLEKALTVISFVQREDMIGDYESRLKNELLKPLHVAENTQVVVRVGNITDLANACEELDALFLFLQLTDNRSKVILRQLSACRNLRIPYVLFRDGFCELQLESVILPVNFLEEEVEKAQFASAFGRFCGSEIKILLANDYGSKAATNAERMKLLFDKFEFKYELQKGTKDSFKVEQEAIQVAENEKAGLIIISASRDYGLDDIIFGPKELHLVKKSTLPLLIVNPRGDLYALCD